MPILNKGSKLYVCAVPQNSDLTAAQFAALTWEEICCPNGAPSISETYNQITGQCLSGKRHTAAGSLEDSSFDIPAMYEEDCVAQDTLRGMVGDNNYYAFRLDRSDATDTRTATKIYTRAAVTGVVYGSDTGVEDWVVDTYTASIQQSPIFVKPAAI